MPSTERFKPYRRGITRDEVLAYLQDSDERPTCRDNLSKRALQVEAASRQRSLDVTLHTSQPDVAINPYQLPQKATTSTDSPGNLVHQELEQSGINPALLQVVEYHDQHGSKYTSSTSESSLSDLESSSCSSQPSEHPLATAQIAFSGEEELINLGSGSSPEAFNDLIDLKQLDGFLSQFEGVDVFAPASVASDPPTPILPPNNSSTQDEVDNAKDNNVVEQAKRSTETLENQSHIGARLDKLIEIQSQALCVNLLTLGMLIQNYSQDSNSPPLPVSKM